MMRTSDKGIVALISHEGVVPAPYYDSVNVLTWGVGHTKAAGEPNPAKMPLTMPADIDAALVRVFEVFQKDLERYEADVRRAIKVPVEQHEFDAAVSFHYNTGAIAKASWVKHLNEGNRNMAARSIMNWKKPPAIIPRRTAERDLFQKGKYPTGKIAIWSTNGRGKLAGVTGSMGSGEALSLLRGSAARSAGRSDKKPSGNPAKGVAALFALAAAGFYAFACKIPFVADLFSKCGG